MDKKQYPYIQLDEFIIMPNHIYGIINIVGAHCNAPLHNRVEKFGRSISNSIPTIIKLFKSTTTKQINQLRNAPQKSVWQRNYYEHIIRDERDLSRIREYIINNPVNWNMDENNIKNKVTVQACLNPANGRDIDLDRYDFD
ncbi:MAG: transposase [Candidatus Omnitrophota bacterium]